MRTRVYRTRVRDILIIVSMLWFVAATRGADALGVEDTDLALRFDAGTGAWTGLVDKRLGEDLVVAPGLGVPDDLQPPSVDRDRIHSGVNAGTVISLLSHQAEGQRALTLVMRSGPFLVRANYCLHDGGIVSRQFSIENASAKPQTVRTAVCRLPVLTVGFDMAGIFPDSLPVGDQVVARLDPVQPICPTSQDGLVYLWAERAQRGIGTWVYAQDEYAPATVQRKSTGVAVQHKLDVLAQMQPGQKIQLAEEYIWLSHGSRDDLLRSVQRVFAIVGLHAPAGCLGHLREKVIYCGHPGGMPEQKFLGYGGFKALQAYLPTLEKMGVDLLWMLPIFEHGDGIRWNLYSPFDQIHISPLYGTPDELKQLSSALSKAGIGLMFDLVPHGPPDHTDLAKSHPEWVCIDEAGKPTYVWGQLAFDNAHPGWREYMRQAAAHHAREYGIIGARIDVAAGSPPNWDHRTGYRPSHATLGGGLAMQRAIREGLLRANAKVVLLPEEYTGARVFCRDADLTYDVQLFLLMVELQSKAAEPEQWARQLQQFLHDQAQTMPPGSLKMRWTANHDTVSWIFQKKRTRDAFGLPRARALLGFCCLIDGVPMIYQGEEDPALYGGNGPSMVDDIAAFVRCRRTLLAMRGTADYSTLGATNGVFACLRSHEGSQAIVLISFNPKDVTTVVTSTLGAGLPERWRDELTGETVALSSVPMRDHQIRVLLAAPATSRP